MKVISDDNSENISRSKPSPKTGEASAVSEASIITIKSKDVTHAVNHFMEEQQADILAMLPHKHAWTDKLFKKSETKDMVFHTKIPLLILPEK